MDNIAPLDPQVAHKLLRTMLLLRRFERKAQDLYRRGMIPGFIHLYVGEEAVASGVCAHLNQDDYVTSTPRGHGHALAKGVPPREVMAELWAKATGCSRGRGGSMHLYAPDHGLLGSNGLVGPGIPIAAGAALAAKLRGSGQVAVSFFGDGAVNHGSFHEGINLAGAWKLPAVFVCENNLYATETPFRVATANPQVSNRGPAYGIESLAVDGNDAGAVHHAAGDAIERARRGEGPTLIECRTYRVVGHHEGDPGTGYRSKEEVESWIERCPIENFRRRLIENGILTPGQCKALEHEVEAVIDDAVLYAESSPSPQSTDPEADVFPSAEGESRWSA